jgi:hypothetical protein
MQAKNSPKLATVSFLGSETATPFQLAPGRAE